MKHLRNYNENLLGLILGKIERIIVWATSNNKASYPDEEHSFCETFCFSWFI